MTTASLARKGEGMRRSRWWSIAALCAAAMFALAGCGSDDDEGDGGGGGAASGELDKVTLQSKWVVQAQFAGGSSMKDLVIGIIATDSFRHINMAEEEK